MTELGALEILSRLFLESNRHSKEDNRITSELFNWSKVVGPIVLHHAYKVTLG